MGIQAIIHLIVSARPLVPLGHIIEMYHITFLCKQHEWIIKFHSQIIRQADLRRVFASLQRTGK